MAAYFFVNAKPSLSSRQACCPYKNNYLVTAHCLRGNRPAKGAVFGMSQPRLKLVWVNGTWLSTPKKTKVNSSAESGKRANRLVRGWAWLRLNGSAVSALILFLGVPWYLGRLYVQLESADQALYGDAGVIKRVDGLHNDLIWMKGFVTGTYGEIAIAQGYQRRCSQNLARAFLRVAIGWSTLIPNSKSCSRTISIQFGDCCHTRDS